MVVPSHYCTPAPAPTPAAMRQVQQPPLYLGTLPGSFRPTYHPKLLPEHQPVPQHYRPQFLDLQHGAPFFSDYGPPVKASLYPHQGHHSQQTYHNFGSVGNGVNGPRTFRRKRGQVSNDLTVTRPVLSGNASTAVPQLPVSSQQPPLSAALLSRETYDIYRRIAAELEAGAQREKEFARYIQSVEARANSGRRPPAGSLSAMMQSLADKTAHLARCFEAHTRELALADNDADTVDESDAMVEEIVASPTSPVPADGREPPDNAIGTVESEDIGTVNPQGQAPDMGVIGATTPRRRDKGCVLSRRMDSPKMTSSPAPSSSTTTTTATLSEDPIDHAVIPLSRLHLGIPVGDRPQVAPSNANTSENGVVGFTDARNKVVTPPVDSRRAKPDALPFPLPEFSPFSQLAFEPASAPARLVEEELYFCMHR